MNGPTPQTPLSNNPPQTAGFMSVWGTIFLAIAIAVSIGLHIVVVLATGLSAKSDIVFGTEALVSGVISEAIIRSKMHRKLVPLEKLNFSFLWFWIPLCLYVILARPFE